MKKYCYHFTRHGKRVLGGTVSANSMEEAAIAAIQIGDIDVRTESGWRSDGSPWETSRLYRDGKEVFGAVSISPENFS